MSHATELIRQIIRKQGLHTIYPGQDDSSFNDLLQTAWVQIERTLYKFRAKPHCRPCYNPDRPNDSALYIPGELEYGIITYDELYKLGISKCPKCRTKIQADPVIEASQDIYGGSESVLYRGNSKVFNMWCVAPHTMIPTCHGPLPASEVLYHFESGLPIHVYGLDQLSIVEAMKIRDATNTVIVKTLLDYEIECSPEHMVYAQRNGEIEWTEAGKLQPNDLVALQLAQDCFADHNGDDISDISLSRRGSWTPPLSMTQELAYIIGLFIAEGSYSYGKLVIYTVDDEVIAYLTNNTLGLNFIHEPQYQRVSLCNVRFIELLQRLGFAEHTSANSKSIPNRLLCLSRQSMSSLLSGMFDGDGHSTKHNGCVGYTSTSSILISQLRMILLNYGILTKLSIDKRTSRQFGKYNSMLSGASQLLLSTSASKLFYKYIGFKLNRKQANYHNLKQSREIIYGLNSKFKSLYEKYGDAGIVKTTLRSLLRNSKCTVDAAKVAANAWSEHADDIDYKFINDRIGEYSSETDRIIWLPIKRITTGQSELLDMAVNAPNHSYIANGLVVHNSQISRTVILAHIKKEGRDRKNAPSYRDHVTRKLKHIAPEDGHINREVPSAGLEAEIMASVGPHYNIITPAATQLSDTMVRFLSEAREICKYDANHITILNALENLLRIDDKPAEGIIGKLVQQSGLSRVAVTDFMRTIRLRSFDFTDSPIARADNHHRFDRRKVCGGNQDDDD